MRGVKSLAYDLVVPPGRVSGRVALLLRSTERQPARPDFFQSESSHSPPPAVQRFRGQSEGGDRAVGSETLTRASAERE